MKTVSCPKCGKEVPIDISKAIDEHAEVFICSNCNWKFRYASDG